MKAYTAQEIKKHIESARERDSTQTSQQDSRFNLEIVMAMMEFNKGLGQRRF